jgi:hypothetical protein
VFWLLVFSREIGAFWGFLGFLGLVVGLEYENNPLQFKPFYAILRPLKTTR